VPVTGIWFGEPNHPFFVTWATRDWLKAQAVWSAYRPDLASSRMFRDIRRKTFAAPRFQQMMTNLFVKQSIWIPGLAYVPFRLAAGQSHPVSTTILKLVGAVLI
jgi:hypothetical protein